MQSEDERRATKRAYDKTPEAKAAKKARRDRADQKQVTQAYNAKWYAEKGWFRSLEPAVKLSKQKYLTSEKGRETINRLSRLWNKTPKGRAALRHHAGVRRAREYAQLCECCDFDRFRSIYEAAEWLHCEVDHRVPLAAGGAHCVKNLQILTIEQHKVKTKLDRKLIADWNRQHAAAEV